MEFVMDSQPPKKRRRSVRGTNSIPVLSDIMLRSGTITVFITGAGLSAASGIPTFRHSPDAVWSGDVWTSATREVFRKNPTSWWNNFWLQSFPLAFQGYSSNPGHEAIAEICNNAKGQVKVLTQNVDGLHQSTKCKWNWEENLVEAHGRLGLYKCIPTEAEEEEEDKLGDEEKLKEKSTERKARRACWCKYSHLDSLFESDIEPKEVRDMMTTGENWLNVTSKPAIAQATNVAEATKVEVTKEEGKGEGGEAETTTSSPSSPSSPSSSSDISEDDNTPCFTIALFNFLISSSSFLNSSCCSGVSIISSMYTLIGAPSDDDAKDDIVFIVVLVVALIVVLIL
uniref:Deacetylase sirtuin-type domain-containing protein n=1 Tax=Triparma pacifica TaxID=91992 RepID=A0A7S2QWE1_9STRA|mmetsp:Transcript_1700/g.3228  ORF Transcript_1700/g.3228 Transcript_1700/m.3228 type:complete len:341 (+) Transcript_1700:155-1177(+)